MTQREKTQTATPVPGYHPVTRWLHAGLVLGVVFQLICAAQMAHPDHDKPGGGGGAMSHAEPASGSHDASAQALGQHGHDVLASSIVMPAHAESVMAETQHPMHKKGDFEEWLTSAHRTGGVVVALIVLANLWWAIMLRGSPRKRQIGVLLSAQHWSEAGVILKRLPLMLMGKHPLPDPGNALSLIVEMLGMLTMTAMAVSGSIVWSLWAGPGNMVSEPAELWMEVHSAFAVLLMMYLAGHVSMALLHLRSGDSVFARILP